MKGTLYMLSAALTEVGAIAMLILPWSGRFADRLLVFVGLTIVSVIIAALTKRAEERESRPRVPKTEKPRGRYWVVDKKEGKR